MQMTRERKVYAAVLTLAVTALTADKLFFGPPESQAAAPESLLISHNTLVQPHGPVSARVAPAAEPTDPGHAASAALVERLRHVKEVEGLDVEHCADLFRAPASWAQAPQVGSTAKADFLARHRLMAVLKSSHGGLAVLDGSDRKSVRVGQVIDGFRLTTVGERSATFESPGGKVELELPAAAQPSGR